MFISITDRCDIQLQTFKINFPSIPLPLYTVNHIITKQLFSGIPTEITFNLEVQGCEYSNTKIFIKLLKK